jgi:hypothetical protein
MSTKTERRCAFRRCRKPLTGRNGHALYCNTRCGSAEAYARRQEAPVDPSEEVYLCFGCRNPRERQAEPADPATAVRHPTKSKRPEFSGFCTGGPCACAACRPDGPVAEPKPVPVPLDTPGTCPLPRLPERLKGLHRREVQNGDLFCSCGPRAKVA